MSDAKVIKDFLKTFPPILESLKKPMADMLYALRELQAVTDDYEDLDPDIQAFDTHCTDTTTHFLKLNRIWDDARQELEKMLASTNVKGKSRPKEAETAKAEPTSSARIPSTGDFVTRVQAAIKATPTNSPEMGGWSDHKVFLFAVRERLKMDKKEFSDKMLAAQRDGKLMMTRFDVPLLIKDEKLRKKIADESIKDRGTEFHFVSR